MKSIGSLPIHRSSSYDNSEIIPIKKGQRMQMNFLITVVTLMGFLVAGCAEFPTRYERIETNKVRAIGVTLSPQTEGAPGDTIHARAFFGGEPVASVSWQFSYDRIMTIETDTILNIKPLNIFNTVSSLPDSFDFSFVIPDSTLFLTKAISPDILGFLRTNLPPGMQAMTQADFAAFLKDFGDVDLSDMSALITFIGRWGAAMGISSLSPSSMEAFMQVAGTLIETFSIKGELFAIVTSVEGHTLKIRGDLGIRYNSRFQDIFPVNRNPAVRWIGVYKVKNERKTNSNDIPTLYDDSLTWLYNEFMPWKVRDTVLIEKGFSYFLAADSGIVSFPLKAGDSILNNGTVQIVTSDTTINGKNMLDTREISEDTVTGKAVVDTESYSYDWQYQNLALDGVTQPLDSLFVIVSEGAGGEMGAPPVVKFLPSVDSRMTRARIWVTVSDMLYGERNRPVGQTTRTVDLNFKYTY
jgi:hypothetical protein